MEIREEADAKGLGQPNRLITSSSSLICGSYLVMTIARNGMMSMVSIPAEWGCSLVDSAYVMR